MKNLYTILTLVVLLAGIHQVTYTMDAPEEAPQDKRPPIGTRTQAQALKIALRNMIMELPKKTSKPVPPQFMRKYNPQLKEISAFIQATLLDPGSENAALIQATGMALTLFNIAQEFNHPATMKWLAQNQKRVRELTQELFYSALQKFQYDQAEFWIKYGADINEQNESGQTGLLRHIGDGLLPGNEKRIQWLLEHGANPNLQDRKGYTPLHDAIAPANAPLAKLLLDHGARADIKNNNDQTARDIYFRLNPEDRQRLDNAGIAQRLGIKDTDEK